MKRFIIAVCIGLLLIIGIREALYAEGVTAQKAPKRATTTLSGKGFILPPISPSHLTQKETRPSLKVSQPPDQFDLRDSGRLPSIKDQNPQITTTIVAVSPQSSVGTSPELKLMASPNGENAGTCSFFASNGQAEFKTTTDELSSDIGSRTPGFWDFSENNIAQCNWYKTSDPNYTGGGNYLMIANMLSKKGLVLEEDDPYVPPYTSACDPNIPYQKTLLDWRIISADWMADTDVLKHYIITYGPIFTAMHADFPEFMAYDGSYTLYSPELPNPNELDQFLDHAVLIVGWDDNLEHDGGKGAWIVRNSWGTGWGDEGYFTIAYGSAGIGYYSSFMYDWQDYDNDGGILYYDEAGLRTAVGYGDTTAWGMVRFTPTHNSNATRVEFWTVDRTSDIDIQIYDDFDGASPSNLLTEKLNISFDEAGYHSVQLNTPLPITAGNDVFVVVKITNATDGMTYPIPFDDYGPHEVERTYSSPNGVDWDDAGKGEEVKGDVAIRLRFSDMAGYGDAIPLTPGISIEGTTQGASSYITAYACAGSGDETGAELLYTFTITLAGDVSATLLEGAADLDVFILSAADPASCEVFASGSGSAAVLNDAPPGTYYVAVDGRNNYQGEFTLQVVAENFLNTSGAITLVPDDPYSGDTTGAPSNVTSYSCAGSGDETGPEQIHIITIPQNGTLTATLIEGADLLDIFILDAADPATCLAVGSGTGVPAVYNGIQAGVYYIVIDGRNGYEGPYTLEVTLEGADETFNYFGYVDHGGTWHDADKETGNPDDDWMCWAAAAANILGWTDWGMFDSAMDIFYTFQDYWTNGGGLMEYGWHWWFDGTPPPDEAGWAQLNEGWSQSGNGGAYWPEYNFFDYFYEYWAWDNSSENWGEGNELMTIVDEYLHSGYGTSVAIYTEGIGHALSVWGYEYDEMGNYTGIWVTDSDDNMDGMKLLAITLDLDEDLWYLDPENTDGYQGWFIGGIQALDRKPLWSDIPEPGTFILIGLGLFGMLFVKRRFLNKWR